MLNLQSGNPVRGNVLNVALGVVLRIPHKKVDEQR